MIKANVDAMCRDKENTEVVVTNKNAWVEKHLNMLGLEEYAKLDATHIRYVYIRLCTRHALDFR